MSLTNDFKKIVIENTPLIDVRAPKEYEKGAFLNAVNLPILNDYERHLVGKCYKEHGEKEAVKLGHQLVSGETKQTRIKAWIRHLKQYPNSAIYCFRGGQRSSLCQAWLKEAIGKDIPRLKGGYKAFRHYLIQALDPSRQNGIPILLGGYTGSGKTDLLKHFNHFIDLEALANHRGSSFGRFHTPQPTQSNFENNLAYSLINHKHRNYRYILLEDEGSHIGRCFIPKPLAEFFNSGKLILLDIPFEKRLDQTVKEYVIESQKLYNQYYLDDGLSMWSRYIINSINKIKKRLGGLRYKQVLNEFELAFNNQLKTGDNTKHINWIYILLKEYYDPMYQYQIETTNKKILFKGNESEVMDYINQKYTVETI